MFKELEIVVLRLDVPKYVLREGDVGTVVRCYLPQNVYEVEFANARGKTIAVLTLTPEDIRPTSSMEILHVRELERIVIQ